MCGHAEPRGEGRKDQQLDRLVAHLRVPSSKVVHCHPRMKSESTTELTRNAGVHREWLARRRWSWSSLPGDDLVLHYQRHVVWAFDVLTDPRRSVRLQPRVP